MKASLGILIEAVGVVVNKLKGKKLRQRLWAHIGNMENGG